MHPNQASMGRRCPLRGPTNDVLGIFMAFHDGGQLIFLRGFVISIGGFYKDMVLVLFTAFR